jgi:hypothetical protein
VRIRDSDKGEGSGGGRLLFVMLLLVVAVVFVLMSVLIIQSLLDGQSGATNTPAADGKEVAGESPVRNGDTAAERGEEADGNDSAGGADEDNLATESQDGVRVFIQNPPFVLPASLQPRGYEKGSGIETWKAVSDGSCRDVARDLLLRLRDSGMELVEAGYLDLFGEAWGCVLEDNGEASLTIVLIPEEPFRQRGASNLLRMTMIRTAVPQQDLLAQGTGKER